MTYLLILSPMICLFVGLFLFRSKLIPVVTLSFFVALFMGRFFWGMYPFAIFGALTKAFFITLDVSLIVLGALSFLEFMKKRHVIRSIILYLYKLSDDLRIQFIFIGWLFGAFIEGTAGFGVPGLLISPLLIGLGLNPVQAVSLALLSNTVPVTFGAAGTPIRVGFYEYASPLLVSYTGLFGLVMAIIWPLVLLHALTQFLKRGKAYFWSGVPFALLSGLAFGVPYYFVSSVNPDLPTILGASIGILVMIVLVKLFRRQTVAVVLTEKVREVLEVTHIDERLPLFKTLAPYAFLISFIFLGRLVPFFDRSATVHFSGHFSHRFLLFNPGIPFLLALALSLTFFKPKKGDFRALFKVVLPKLLRTALLIFLITGIMQILISSGLNFRGGLDMLSFLLAGLHSQVLVYFVPLLGSLGASLSGSATVSNILIGSITAELFADVGIPLALILASQLVGASGGNMVSLQNIVTGQLTAGPIQDQEVPILKLVFPYFLLYVGLVTALLVGGVFFL